MFLYPPIFISSYHMNIKPVWPERGLGGNNLSGINQMKDQHTLYTDMMKQLVRKCEQLTFCAPGNLVMLHITSICHHCCKPVQAPLAADESYIVAPA